MRFNVVVANFPFSLDKWGAEGAAKDRYKRFWRGIPPKSAGDYAFITHMIETTYTDPAQNGRVGVIAPHGVLFRGGAEGLIRRKLVEENLLDAVIGLPPNLFFGTGIPACILIFKRNRPDDRVLFVDASRDSRRARTRTGCGRRTSRKFWRPTGNGEASRGTHTWRPLTKSRETTST